MAFKKANKIWDNPNSRKHQFKKGHTHSEEARRKIKNTKKVQYEEGKLKTAFKKGRTSTKYWVGKKRPEISGEKHYNWQGGITSLNEKLRKQSMWKIWREAIFIRDNFTCQNSNCEYCKNKIGVMIHPHHIKLVKEYPELIFSINNGITYCAEFHLKSGLHVLNSKRLNNGIIL